MEYIINNDPVSNLPKQVRIKSCFVVDLLIHDFNNLKADENSVWINYSVKDTYHLINNIEDNKRRQIISTNKAKYLNKIQNTYNCTKYYYKNLSNEGFYRKIIRFRGVDKDNKIFDKCFLGYFFKEEEKKRL